MIELPTLWFGILAVMLALYVVFDGFVLGAGIGHLFGARVHAERVLVRRALGPAWQRHEVWLLAAGGALWFAFPPVFERVRSDFFLPLLAGVTLLVLRGVSLAIAQRAASRLASGLFGFTSLWLVVLLGAALGNVVRGVPTRGAVIPLWTNFGVSGNVGLFDWYTTLVGATAAAVLTMHGALWLVLKTDGDFRALARETAAQLWAPVGVLVAGMTWATFEIQPHIPERFVGAPWGFGFPALAIAALLGIRRRAREGRERPTFLLSCVFLVGLIASAAFGLYPYVLPSLPLDPALSFSADRCAAPADDLAAGLYWSLPAIALMTLLGVITLRRSTDKVTLDGAR